MKVPVILQMYSCENGVATLAMMLATYKKYVSFSELREHCTITRNGMSAAQLCQAAAAYHLDTELLKLTPDEVLEREFPVVVRWSKRYFAIVLECRKGVVRMQDAKSGEYSVTIDRFRRSYTGETIVYTPGAGFEPGGKRESVLSVLWNRIRNYKWSLVIMIVLTTLITLLGIAQTAMKKDVIDVGLTQMLDLKALPEMTGMFVVALLIFLLSAFRTRLNTDTSKSMAVGSAGDLFRKLLMQPMEFYEKFNRGEIINRVRSNTGLDSKLLSTLVPKFVSSVLSVFYISLLFQYNKTIALVCMGVKLFGGIIVSSMQASLATMNRSLVSSTSASQSTLMNGLDTIDTIRATGSERRFYNAWSESQMRNEESEEMLSKMRARVSLAGNIQSVVSSAVLLYMGAYFIMKGQFTIGMMSAFQGIFDRLSGSVNSILDISSTVQTLRADIERIEDITERETIDEVLLDPDREPRKLSGNLKLEHVTYRYNSGDDPAVSDINLDIKAGEMIALVGGSGCGKSTLMKIVDGLYTPQEGSVLYDGKPRTQIADVEFYSSVSTVDQEVRMFEDTVENNIKVYDATISNEDMVNAAIGAEIHQRIMQERDGYDAEIWDNGGNFSGGELQRLELARALSLMPTVLLLDEFTSALDTITEERVFRSIRERKVTCIIAAHRLSTVTQCDRIVVMQHGKIVETGTHEELYRQNGIYTELVESH